MEITFRFTGALRTGSGLGTLNLSVDAGTTLREALLALHDEVPPSLWENVVEPFVTVEADPPLALLLVNRVHLQGAADLDRPIADGDIVAFVLPMEGG